MVTVSATFWVSPSLTEWWAACCSFTVCSIASATSFRKLLDRCLASVAAEMTLAHSGVYGPSGSTGGVLGFSVWSLIPAPRTADTAWHTRSSTLDLSCRAALSLFLAPSSTCSCFWTDLSCASKMRLSFNRCWRSAAKRSSAPSGS